MKNSVPSKTCKDSKFFRINGARINKISNLTTELDDLERQNLPLQYNINGLKLTTLKQDQVALHIIKKDIFLILKRAAIIHLKNCMWLRSHRLPTAGLGAISSLQNYDDYYYNGVFTCHISETCF